MNIDEAIIQKVIEDGPMGILMHQGAEYIYVNKAVEALTGYKREELLKMKYWEVAADEFKKEIRERSIKRRAGTKVPSRYLLKIKRKDGQTRWLDMAVGVISLSEKKLVVATAYDVTEQKLAQDALSESEKRYRQLFESINDVYYRTDMKGVITAISPSVFNRTGYRAQDLIGKPVQMVYVDPGDREKLVAELVTKGLVNDFELKLKRRNGEAAIASVSSRVVLNEKGQPIAVEGIMRDMSERKRIEEELEVKVEELERLNRIMVDRELKMVELKQQIKRLKGER
jgi:PAS domain S-box-containing protein